MRIPEASEGRNGRGRTWRAAAHRVLGKKRLLPHPPPQAVVLSLCKVILRAPQFCFFIHCGYFNPFCQKILTMGFFTEEHRSFALLAASFVAGCGLLFSISGSWVGLASVFPLIHPCRPPGKPGGGPSQTAGREHPLLLPQSLLPNTGGGGSGSSPAGCTPGPCAGRPACWDHTAEPCPVHLHLRDHR